MKVLSKYAKHLYSRIGLKLIIPYLVSSFVIFLVISGLIFYNYQSDIVSTKDVQKEIAIRSSTEIDFYLQNILRELSLTKKNISCLTCEDKRWKDTLEVFMSGNPSVFVISVTDENGNELYRTSRYEDAKGLHMKSNYQEETTKEVLLRHEQYLSAVYISEYELPSLTAGMPILSSENKLLGTVVVGVDLSPLWNTISKIQVGETGYVYVADKKGGLITYKDIGLVKQKQQSEPRNIASVQSILNENNNSGTYTSFTGEKVIGTRGHSQITGWDVIVELPFKEVLTRLYPLLILAVFSFTVFIFLIFFILNLIYRKLLIPLDLLKEGVDKLESGTSINTIKTTEKDEIGDLADSFNDMSKNLKRSREELDAYNKDLERKIKVRTQELTDANVRLRELDKQKSEFVSMASHQLRTPITAIGWCANLFLKGSYGALSDEMRDPMEKISQSSKQLARIIEDFLDITKIEQGKLAYQFSTVDIKEIIQNLVKELKPRAEDKNLKLTLHIEEGSYQTSADSGKIRQVLSNLIDNSIKYTASGEIIVTLSHNLEQKKIHIAIKDSGMGISPETMDKLFKKFSRADGNNNAHPEGSGLGLYVAQEMIKEHQGRIWAESEGEGKGSTFYVELSAKG